MAIRKPDLRAIAAEGSKQKVRVSASARRMATQERCLEAVAETGTVARAAKQLGVTPEHVAAQLRKPIKFTAESALENRKLARRAIEAEAKAAAMLDRLESVEQELLEHAELASKPLPPIARRELGRGTREGTIITLLSDLHLETRVHPESTPVGNAFSLPIADLRMQRAFDGILWHHEFASHGFKLRDLVLWLGGDIITNHLHPENIETAQLGPVGAMLFAQDLIERGLRQLLGSNRFERIDVVCSVGNHGRTTDKMRSVTAGEHSWETVLYHQLARTFADDDRLNVYADRLSTHQYHTVYEFDLHFHHGHEVRYGGGVGGISIPMNKATAQWDKVRSCHYHHYGHYHQYLDSGAVTNNGSLIGYDPYAMSVKATPEPPQQALYVLDSKRGKSIRSPLWVSDPSKELEIWRVKT